MNRNNFLIIYCHPNPESFTHAALENVILGLQHQDRTFQVLDLYSRQFDPVLVFGKGRKRRDLINDPEMEEYRNLISTFDNIIFIYPVWWGGFPALLKGFIDRTFVSELAYTFKGKSENNIFPKGLMKGKKAYFIYSLDSPFLVALFDPGWLNIKWTIFKYCGFSKVKRIYLSGLKRKSIIQKKTWLEKLTKYFSNK